MRKLHKYIIKTFLILVALCIIDFTVGKIFDNLIYKLPIDGGQTANLHYSINNSCQDILIIGSSTALCNYDSRTLSDSSHYKVHNSGIEYGDMLFESCIFNSIANRCPPKMLIWNIDLSALHSTGDISRLYPYYNKDKLAKESIIHKEGNVAKIKMLSNMYKYNSVFLGIIISKLRGTIYKGFEGTFPKSLNESTIKDLQVEILEPNQVDDYLVTRFKNMLKLCKEKDIKVIIVRPTTYCKLVGTTEEINVIDNICKKYEIPLIDNSQSKYMLSHPEFFFDNRHLNLIGAIENTKMFYLQIKPYLKELNRTDNRTDNHTLNQYPNSFLK